MRSHILVVDDDSNSRALVTTALEQLGYEVTARANGNAGVVAALESPPDLVLMDVEMPDMDGFSACEALKAEPATKDIPLIFMTGRDADGDLARGFDAGGVDYITKPFGVIELKLRVRTHLALRDALLQLEQKHASLIKAHRRLKKSKAREKAAFNAVGDALEGKTFAGRYLLGDRIGEGGMGVVLSATQIDLDREVAVKILRPGEGAQREARQIRFEREGRATCAVHHPSAITVLDAGVADGLPYIVMERLNGQTLAQIMAAKGTIPLEQALSITATVADVLATAHAADVVHRDIKPENVFLDEVGEGTVVKVLDFGVAKLLGDEHGQSLTRDDFVGTPGYMAPEMFSGDEGVKVTGQADVYAVGVMLFEMLAGTPPIVAGSTAPMALLGAHLFTEPRQLSEFVDVPAPLEALVARCLAKDPDARPSSATLAAELRALT